MSDEWRVLLYPLGFLASVAFSARFLLQWILSEFKRQSVTPLAFWILSLAGNLLLWCHATVQQQVHVALFQVCNGVIAWRNLNLAQPPSQQCRGATVFAVFVFGIAVTLTLFLLQGARTGLAPWFRVPTFLPGLAAPQVSMAWHLLGVLGLFFLSLRFGIQWWLAEKRRRNDLNPAFWWTSLTGALLCLIYFGRIHDPVNALSALFSLAIGARNLVLLRRCA